MNKEFIFSFCYSRNSFLRSDDSVGFPFRTDQQNSELKSIKYHEMYNTVNAQELLTETAHKQ